MNDPEKAAIAREVLSAAEKATPRPWEKRQGDKYAQHVAIIQQQGQSDPLPCVAASYKHDDAAFIVTACNAAEALARAVQESGWKIEELEHEIANLNDERTPCDECATVQRADPRRHFKGCSKHEPLPEEDQAKIDEAYAQAKESHNKARAMLNAQQQLEAEAYARGRVDGIEAEKKAGVAVYESREEWAKRAHDLARAVLNPAAASHTELNNMADEILARG